MLTLTAIAGWLGPQLSGLLAPFPIIATVLATFTHAQRGVDETLRLLRGLISGFGAFALFCFTLAVSLRSLGIAAGLRCSRRAVALLTQALVSRSSRTVRPPRCGEAASSPRANPSSAARPRPDQASGDPRWRTRSRASA